MTTEEVSLQTFPLNVKNLSDENKRLSDVVQETIDWHRDFEAKLIKEILRKTQIRAGGIFSIDFEAGMVYAKLESLGKAPTFWTRKMVKDWTEKYIYRSVEPNKEILG